LTLRGQHRRTVTVRGVRSGRGRRTRQEPSRVAWEPGRPCRLRLDISWRGDCQTAKPPAPGRRRAWTEPRRQARGAVPPGEPQGSSGGWSQGVGVPHSSVGGRGTCASGTLPSEGGTSRFPLSPGSPGFRREATVSGTRRRPGQTDTRAQGTKEIPALSRGASRSSIAAPQPIFMVSGCRAAAWRLTPFFHLFSPVHLQRFFEGITDR